MSKRRILIADGTSGAASAVALKNESTMRTPGRPSAEELLAALHLVADYFGFSRSTREVFDQDDRPPGVRSRGAYLRLHRVRLNSRTGGWSARGKQRLVTSDAWAAEMERGTRRALARKPRPVVVGIDGGGAPSVDDVVDDLLGIRVKRSG